MNGPDPDVRHPMPEHPRIGSGAVIAARSVVAGEVATDSVVAGNPAGAVRTRYGPETVETPLRVAWWDWPVDRITRCLDAIRGADIRRLEAPT
jgi:virginiamycin A acetyltransferase